ncbi:MAG: porin family protein [Flavobacteriaceae bacterium]
MKKLLILFAFTLSSASIFAQGVDLGLKVGVNFANLSDASNLDLSSKTGFVFGAFAGAKLGDKLGIQGDLLYSAQGAKSDEEGIDDIDLNYVNVPVVLKYFLTDQIHIHAGPQFGFVVDDNVAKVLTSIADAESFDLSGIIGIGVDLPMGIRLDGRYNFGLSDVISSNDKTVVDSGGKNSVITISAGYSFL